jgi:zinc ribbon protein
VLARTEGCAMPEEEKVIHEGSDGPAAQEWGRSNTGKPPGERAAPVPQTPRVEPASLIRVFGGLHRRAQQSLFDMLLPGEQPLVVVPGAAGSGIVGTERRVLVLKAGARFGAPFHARSKAFEYESVIGVRLDTESSPAVVAIDAPLKIVTCRVYWADARDDPWKARNAIPVEGSSFGMVLERVVQLRALVIAYRENHPALWPPREPVRRSPQNVKPLKSSDVPSTSEEAGVVALPVLTDRCPHCRAELRPGWKFCPGCGTPSGAPSSGA